MLVGGVIGGESSVGKKIASNRHSGISIKGEGRDEWGRRFFKFAGDGSNTRIPPFSAEEITENPSKVFLELIHAGAPGFQPSKRSELLRQLDKRNPEPPKFKVVSRLGWNSGAFVLPGKIIGQPSRRLEPSFRHLDQQLLAKYRIKGTLKEWRRQIGKLCAGNFRLMFCASLGLTGPILPLVSGPRSGGFSALWASRNRQDRRRHGDWFHLGLPSISGAPGKRLL
jgi:putative DNA primase/helicase